jgi:hypothetical protein
MKRGSPPTFLLSLGVALLVALVGLGLAGSARRAPAKADFADTPVSLVIFPAQTLPLLFSHAQHLRAAKLPCTYCHDGADESKSSLDHNIPREAVCAECHAIDRRRPAKVVAARQPRADCVACHPGFTGSGPVARVVVPAPNLKFDHRAHAERKIRCQVCHGDLLAENVGLATRAQLPKMLLCLSCHDGRTAPGACTTCHLVDPGGVMKTRYDEGVLSPSGVLRGDAHDLAFTRDHGPVAANDERYCASCHRQEFCVDCHAGVTKPMEFHGGDYVTLHAIEARRNRPDCSACHRLQTFCVGCHSRAGVAFDGKGSEFLGPSSGDLSRRFHPDGWVEFRDGGIVRGVASRSPEHHSLAAQRNLRQCAACHREQFCVTCHTSEAGSPYRINPHPTSWRGSRRCEALRQRAGRMCLRCHLDASQISCE